MLPHPPRDSDRSRFSGPIVLLRPGLHPHPNLPPEGEGILLLPEGEGWGEGIYG